MVEIFSLGLVIGFFWLFLTLIFSITTMRRLRKNPHRSLDFEAQDLYSGADIGATVAAASMPKWWRDYMEKKGKPILREKYDWLMVNTKAWERVLARIVFTLIMTGVLLMIVGMIGDAMSG